METNKLKDILDRWRRDPNFLIEILQDVQDELRHLPDEVMREVADTLRVPLQRVYHAATFYKAFSLVERGKHEVQVCMGTACHVKGAGRVLDAFSRELEVEAGDTTEDKEFTLEAVRCVGCCGLAPVVAVGDNIHGDVSPARAGKVLRPYRKEADYD
ncbi:MAG: NAD(P)H-dependent oxidoreductase subunit E [Deltaproteobacteria bacterium]|nr:NAD(P)H-dependent oxidoreductase subunit E [Deltaproteobacteria bacterium]